MTRANALQSLQAPPGWQSAPEGAPEPDIRSWENVGRLRAIVVARALGGCKRGWFRVSCSVICGGGGAKMAATVRGDLLQATLDAVCAWALMVADKLTFNVEK